MPGLKRIPVHDFYKTHIDGIPGFGLVVLGYPEVTLGPRTTDGHGDWSLSVAAVEGQKILPLELRFYEDSPDVSGWCETPDGLLWMYQDQVYLSGHGLTAYDVRALVSAQVDRERRALQKAHDFEAMSQQPNPNRRESISQAVRLEVWRRDNGRCVQCAKQEKLEYDHIIPVAMGGGNSSRNLQLLCEPCNRRKGATLG